MAVLIQDSSISELRSLPGFDEVKHRSSLVDESVEVRNGVRTVVYRIKQDFMESVNAEFERRMRNRGPSPF